MDSDTRRNGTQVFPVSGRTRGNCDAYLGKCCLLVLSSVKSCDHSSRGLKLIFAGVHFQASFYGDVKEMQLLLVIARFFWGERGKLWCEKLGIVLNPCQMLFSLLFFWLFLWNRIILHHSFVLFLPFINPTLRNLSLENWVLCSN